MNQDNDCIHIGNPKTAVGTIVLTSERSSDGSIQGFICQRMDGEAVRILQTEETLILGRDIFQEVLFADKERLFPIFSRVVDESRNLDEEWNHIRLHGISFQDGIILTLIESPVRIIPAPYSDPNSEKGKDTAQGNHIDWNVFDRVFHGTQDAIFLLEPCSGGDFIYVLVNDSFTKKTGIPREAILGKTPVEMFGDRLGSILRENYARSEATGTITYTEIVTLGDKTKTWVTTLTPIEENGRVKCIVGSAQDATHLKKIEEELSNYRIDLERSNLQLKSVLGVANQALQVKTEFLTHITQELRTPLNSMLGLAELLSVTDVDPEQQLYLDQIRNSGKKLMHTINHILDFSKAESGRLSLECSEFRIYEILELCSDLFRSSVERCGLEYEIIVDFPKTTVVWGDPQRLLQILFNLIDNAIKFSTDNKGKILIKGSCGPTDKRGNREFFFQILDDGIGVPEERIPRIFQPFSRIENCWTQRVEGSGLGLSICDRLVKLMNGSIGCRRRESGGSEFWFTILVRDNAPRTEVKT